MGRQMLSLKLTGNSKRQKVYEINTALGDAMWAMLLTELAMTSPFTTVLLNGWTFLRHFCTPHIRKHHKISSSCSGNAWIPYWWILYNYGANKHTSIRGKYIGTPYWQNIIVLSIVLLMIACGNFLMYYSPVASNEKAEWKECNQYSSSSISMTNAYKKCSHQLQLSRCQSNGVMLLNCLDVKPLKFDHWFNMPLEGMKLS